MQGGAHMDDFRLSRDDDFQSEFDLGYMRSKEDCQSNFDNGDNNKRSKKEKKEKKPKKPILLTKGKFVAIIILVAVLSFGGAFGGMYSYDQYYPTGSGSKGTGSVTTEGYTLAKATGSSLTVQEIAEQNINAVVEIRTESVSSDNWLRE